MIARARLGRIASAALVVALALGCQVALRAENENVRCAPENADCGNGLKCIGGICQRPPPCVPDPGGEICDLKDNDCNGEIDEGFDKDGDGFKECGKAGEIDCNDDPVTGKEIYPGHPEICNGYDDNCNGKTDEEPNDCTAKGEECWSAKGKCTRKGDCRIHGCDNGGCNPETGECSDPDCRITKKCPAGTTCDNKSGLCVRVADIGDNCNETITCKPGTSCMDLTEVGITGRSGTICSKACCEAGDCPPEFVCKAGSAGANICVRATEFGLALGTLSANSKCISGSECRSGVCSGGFCQDGCCGSLNCGNGGTCSLKSDNKFLCRTPAGSGGTGAYCDSNSQCKSGVCWTFFLGGSCTQKCCSSADCPTDWRCGTFNRSGSIVSYCAPLSFSETQGSKLPGELCGTDADCRSVRCIDGRCSDTCCHDSECGAGTLCKPKKISGGVPLRCVP